MFLIIDNLILICYNLCQMEHFCGGAMLDDWVKKSFLFNGIGDNKRTQLLSIVNPEYIEYKKGEYIYSPNKFDKKIGFVVRGECLIQKNRTIGDPIPLNALSVGDSFGVVAVFTGCEEFPTNILATKDCIIAYFSKENVVSLMNKNVAVSLNIIQFLASKVQFLNNKISSFSSDNVEQKVALYILNLYKDTQENTLKFNKKHAADLLNTGRTSLYRALSSLEDSGIIKIDNKNIIILDHNGLERKAK